MVHDVISEVTASYGNSTLRVETSGELRGRWDCERLSQALTNLVVNAVQHGSPESPIVVVARGTPDELVLAVHNTGPPIGGDQLRRIFQPMKSAGGASRTGQHLGLGLYIVDKIADAHGGAVEVQSSEERGTTFTMRLPRRA